MKREDFVFDHMDDEYEDYWFKVVGDNLQVSIGDYSRTGNQYPDAVLR